MAAHKAIVLVVVLLQTTVCIYGQDIGNSAGQAIGTLTNMLVSMERNTSAIDGVLDMLKDPGEFMAKIGNSDQAMEVLQRLHSRPGTITMECLQHAGMVVQALTRQEEWALRMVDAIGKPPSGLLQNKLLWLGDWSECIAIEATVYQNLTSKSNPSHPFTGKYCSVNFLMDAFGMIRQQLKFTIGTCLPSSCSSSDGTALMRALVGLMPKDTLNVSIPEPKVTCQENSLPLDGQAIAVIIVCSVFVAVMTLATIYDVVYVHWLATRKTKPNQSDRNGINLEKNVKKPEVNSGFEQETETSKCEIENSVSAKPVTSHQTEEGRGDELHKYKPSALEGVLMSFSMFTNGTKILNTHQPKGALTAVNGIRFISMTWVIVGHSFGMLGYFGETDNYFQYGMDLMKRREFIAILNGTFSVDTFFVLSGLLVSYLTLKEIEKRKGVKRFNWGMYYFHRFWRLTPPYMLLLMVWVSLDKYFANGPLWHQEGFERDQCRKTWWTNLLYINNLVDKDDRINTRGGASSVDLRIHNRREKYIPAISHTIEAGLVTSVAINYATKTYDINCFGVTWYLANDMQFYVIGPLVLIPLYLQTFNYFIIVAAVKSIAAAPKNYEGGISTLSSVSETQGLVQVLWSYVPLDLEKMCPVATLIHGSSWRKLLLHSPILGGLACLALLLVSTVSSGVISWKYNMLPPPFFQGQAPEFGWEYYDKPWCRIGPYAVGLFTGYLLYRYKLKLRINRYLNVFLWIVALTLGFLIVYGLYTPDLISPLSVNMSALYNATARSVWGACVAWVIFACANGYGGPVNHLLSWPGFIPLGRLTYFAYLVHPLLQIFHHGSQLSTTSAYDYGAVYVILGDICMSYAASFVLSLAFEAPMMGLEKVLLGRDKRN